jgi:hypothetical protein
MVTLKDVLSELELTQVSKHTEIDVDKDVRLLTMGELSLLWSYLLEKPESPVKSFICSSKSIEVITRRCVDKGLDIY